jgi:hypothetical protein
MASLLFIRNKLRHKAQAGVDNAGAEYPSQSGAARDAHRRPRVLPLNSNGICSVLVHREENDSSSR